MRLVSIHKWSFSAISALGAKIQILDIALLCLRFKSGARRSSRKNPHFWTDTSLAHCPVFGDHRPRRA